MIEEVTNGHKVEIEPPCRNMALKEKIASNGIILELFKIETVKW